MPDETPATNKDAFICMHCNAYAHQRTSDFRIGSPYADPMHGISKECVRCGKHTIWFRVYNEYKLIYPDNLFLPVAHPDMPPYVRELYDEARVISSVSTRHGMVAMRMCLEGITREQNVYDGNLKSSIAALCKKKNIIDDELVPFEFIRDAGNSSVHLEETYTKEDLILVSKGIHYISEMVYERPKRIDEMKKLKNQSKSLKSQNDTEK